AVLGLVLVAVALALWMVLLRPWTHYDDLETPHFTGHHDHHNDAAPTAEAPDHAEPRAEAVDYPAPATNIPEEAPPGDDLTLIEGIGPKAEAALKAAGINTYIDLANAQESALRSALSAANLAGMGVETWPKQARFVVNKDVESFEKYKQELAAGRSPSGAVDDLKIIEGVGPKTEQVLIAAGITSYAQLAATTSEDLRAILAEAKLHMFNPDSWPKQAQYAADGDIAGLEAYQEKLDGGVDPDLAK
ncbi:MAG: helix-hairpin-helix domain-containing protein, partial [Anaerolineales bacterium]